MRKQLLHVISIITALILAVSLSACGTATASDNYPANSPVKSAVHNTPAPGGNAQNLTPPVDPPKPSTAPRPSSAPSTAPSQSSGPREGTQYFTNGDEVVSVDAAKGQWLFRSPTINVKVDRLSNKTNVQTYFVADVRLKPGETERSGFSAPLSPGHSGGKVYQVARAYQAVIAIDGDFMQYVEPNLKGVIIRNGKAYLDNSKADTLAFMPDGTLNVFKPKETTAKMLLASGVNDTFSFGPTLVADGRIASNLDKARLNVRNPRTAVGMVEPYHYILVVVDGRQKGYSVGMTFKELAQVFLDNGCTVAYNLDGGQSATMSFMGTNISKYGGSLTGQRKVPDTLMFGKSDKVPKK